MTTPVALPPKVAEEIEATRQWLARTGGYAFPRDEDGGMTLRDYFAARAMQSAILAWLVALETNKVNTASNVHHFAAFSYRMADAMLKARGE